MAYYYKSGVIFPFVQKFYKQMIVVVAAIFVASMAAMTLSANAAAPKWTANAPATITFSCGGTEYVHTLNTVNQTIGGALTGNGTWNNDPVNYTWELTGEVSGDMLDASILYTGTVGNGSVYELNGTIAANGSVSGTSSNGCQTFTMSAGSFTAYDAVETEVDVYGSTTATQNDPGKWFFNRDPSTATPYEFNNEASVLGLGSLYVKPIANNFAGTDCTPSDTNPAAGCNKFIGEYFAMTPIEQVESFSYDFKIGSGGDASDENEFYMNVYANFGQSADDKFYDCRYEVVPTIGSTAGFTTVTFDPTQSYPVTTRGGASFSPFTCPSIPADMDDLSAGSNIRAFALNVGDVSINDQDLDGYFDKVVLTLTNGDSTTFDLEPVPTYTVTINKYVDGVQATAVNANNASFPMVASWDATNIGSGTGNYELDADGFNNVPVPYQAITSEMTQGADYTTNEITGNSVVAATTCAGSGAKFELVGYTVGDTLAEAQAGTPNTTIPSFTDLQGDKNVIVWNKTCVYVTNKDQCKDGGWMLGLADGRTFKNQGDCVSFYATKEKNNPAGSTTTTLRVR